MRMDILEEKKINIKDLFNPELMINNLEKGYFSSSYVENYYIRLIQKYEKEEKPVLIKRVKKCYRLFLKLNNKIADEAIKKIMNK
jgi:hypothetical protein